MKASIFLVFFSVVLAGAVNAQHIQLDGPKRAILSPLVLVDSLEANLNYLVLNPNSIEKIDVLKDARAINVYGDRGKNGVIFITTKQNVVMSRLNAILNKFNVAPSDRHLEICIDKILVKDTTKLLIEPNEVEKIEITTERIWNYPSEQPTGEKYINIITHKSGTAKRN